MDHEVAVNTYAAERYLLGEMDGDERDSYEEHFFSCPECAEAVKGTARFRTAAESILREETDRTAAAPRRRDEDAGDSNLRRMGWRAWFWPMPVGVAASLVVLVGLVGYQSALVLPDLRGELREARALQAAPSYFLSVSRSATSVVRVSQGQRMVALRLSQSFSRSFPFYVCELRDADDRTVLSSVLASPPAAEELQVLLPTAGLPAGAYAIAVAGLDSEASPQPASEFTRYHFTLERGAEGDEQM